MPPLRVLVVDDEPSIARCLALFLHARGMEAEFTLDSFEAVRMLAETHYDVLILDLRLGLGLRGDEVLAAATVLDPDLPQRTVFLTGDISVKGEQLILQTRCPMIRKPFDLTVVVDAVRALDRRHQPVTRREEKSA